MLELKIARWLVAAVLAAVASVGTIVPARADSAPAPAPPGVPVKAASAARQDYPILLRNIGTVQAYASVLVRARVDGTIDKLFFTEGQDVEAGAPLAQIDPRPYAATYAAALGKKTSDEATLANAQRDLSRYSTLAKSDFASRQQVDTQQALVATTKGALQSDDANLASAKLNLDYAYITSPISGRTGLRLVDPGNLVQAANQTGIVSVTQIHPISVVFTLPQQNLPQIQDGMRHGKLPVQAWSGDDQTELGTGTLLTINNQIDQSTGTISLKATFPNKDDRLWPGQFINARLQVATLPHALVIPSVAVQHGPNGLFAFVVKPDDTVALVPIEVSQDDGRLAVVTKGLDDGAKVVTDGQSRLQGGTKVSVRLSGATGS
jgi:multidrug efflux system membrane fusion protein